MQCAKKWLSVRADSHNNCRISSGSSDHGCFRPTRLIEIGKPEPRKVRLRDSAFDQVSMSAQYATLSHRWGATKSLKLTSTSLQCLVSGVPILDLAKKIQDAIFAAKSLDINFLWIDFLCIL
jgi:hypothetical protein